MNDDFLRRLRRPPSAAFEHRLREQLRQQELNETSQRRPGWKLLAISLLVGGSALATATYLTMTRGPSPSSPSVQNAPTQTESAAPVPPRATQNSWRETNEPAFDEDAYAFTDSSTPPAQTESPMGAGRSGDSASARSSSGGTETNRYISSGGLQTSAVRPVRIVASADIAALAKDTLPGARYTASASFEVERTDAALRALCAEREADQPDIVIASRRVRKEELRPCQKRYNAGALEATLGHIAIVVTRAKIGMPLQLSTRTLRLAVLKKVPSPDNSGLLVANPYTHWNQIDPALEDRRIEVLGPARDTPEFAVFAATVLAPACEDNASLDEQTCQGLREDGVYAAAVFDNNFVRQRLWSDPNVVAIVDYRFYAANSADLLGSLLPGAAPTQEFIVDGSYVGARTLRAYVNRLRARNSPRVGSFVNDYLHLPAHLYKVLIPPDGNLDSRRSYLDGPKLTEVKLD